MEFAHGLFVQPFLDIADGPWFFLEVLIGGLMSGVMYSLVALGFVLIYKASGVFNFAQGIFVLFAALNFAGMIDLGLHPAIAFLATLVVMVALAYGTERLVLRKLVNQPDIVLFMSTIGLAFLLQGLGELVWGGNVRPLDIGIPDGTLEVGEMLLQEAELVAGVTAGVLVVGLALFFQYTAVGRALRAVADDHQAAQSIGIPLSRIWVIVWSVAGFVALVAGILWGAKIGVQFSLSILALKALPVLILGGFTSVPGAIIGGLIVGASEKVAEVYWGQLFGGAIEEWFAYMLALVFLFFRPQGLFGERLIERV